MPFRAWYRDRIGIIRSLTNSIASEGTSVTHPAMSPNNVAVVTGGASGIGLAAAMRFARLGMKVCIADIGGDRLADAETKLASAALGGGASIMASAVDVSRLADVEALGVWRAARTERRARKETAVSAA